VNAAKRRASLPRRILTLLEASAALLSTPEIIAAVGTHLPCPRTQVWTALRRLERFGLVRRSGKAQTPGTRRRRLYTVNLWEAKEP